MLFFRLNMEESEFSLSPKCKGDIQDYFFKKLKNDFSIEVSGVANALFDEIKVPVDAFNIDDEKDGKLEEIIRTAIALCEQRPLEELNGESLGSLGIHVDFCKKISNRELEDIVLNVRNKDNLEYLTEEIIPKKIGNDKIVEKYSSCLASIGTEDSELIVLDPYIFSSDHDEYLDLLTKILERSNAKSIIVVTKKGDCKQNCLKNVKSKIPNLSEKWNGSFHDRFWIAGRKEGFLSGTSLNGVGKKYSILAKLEKDDVSDIIEKLLEEGIIE